MQEISRLLLFLLFLFTTGYSLKCWLDVSRCSRSMSMWRIMHNILYSGFLLLGMCITNSPTTSATTKLKCWSDENNKPHHSIFNAQVECDCGDSCITAHTGVPVYLFVGVTRTISRITPTWQKQLNVNVESIASWDILRKKGSLCTHGIVLVICILEGMRFARRMIFLMNITDLTPSDSSTQSSIVTCWLDENDQPYHSDEAFQYDCVCGDSCITGHVTTMSLDVYVWGCACVYDNINNTYVDLCPLNDLFEEHVCCVGDLCNAVNWTEPTNKPSTTLNPNVTTICWLDTNSEPFHTDLAIEVECLCGDSCFMGHIDLLEFFDEYVWDCGCDRLGVTLCPSNDIFDETRCCQGALCNAGNWSDSTTTTTTTTMTTPTTISTIVTTSSVSTTVKCWLDESSKPYHSSFAKQVVCDCGDSCITAYAQEGRSRLYVWGCGCEIISDEVNLCPTNDLYDDYVCCKGDLCNGNWTEPTTIATSTPKTTMSITTSAASTLKCWSDESLHPYHSASNSQVTCDCGDSCITAFWTQQLGELIYIVTITCVFDVTDQPFHSNSVSQINCTCGDSCFMGYFNYTPESRNVYDWTCGCDAVAGNLCPTNDIFDEY
ncbi:unnamed protein product, partial [Mesorhabditis belari]|uniref:Uncharacterized protein n=1 Tax=Mesorhabditis belari TaxID=2138241 RepID=A0AAF3EJA6_9BILA